MDTETHQPDQLTLMATCAFGLEAVVKRELVELGYDPQVVQPGKVQFSGSWEAVCDTNLWLRTADRVLLLVKRFQAADFDALFETTKEIEWEALLPADACFPVNGKSRLSQLTSVPAIQRATKRAIVDRLKSVYKSSLDESGALYKIEIALLNNEATLTIDTTGPSLHKRGYRQLVGTAPLKETLAAAMVQLSFWRPDRQLIDPFCGSGTIPIEAACLARRIAPGLNREFSAEAWHHVDETTWSRARDAARQARCTSDPGERILGTDSDPEVLSLARHHAERAGVADLIHWQEKSFESLRSKKEYGCVITNPPYGERLSEIRQVKDLYRTFPAVLSRLPTWSHFILTSLPNFERVIQKSADRRRKLYNGRIECMYYQFHGPKKGDAVAATESTTEENTVAVKSVFGGLDVKAHEQAELFASRLRKRAKHLRRWPTKFGITCFRLYERDIPEIPLCVDRYEEHLHITEFERPSDRDLGQQAKWLELMAKTAAKTLEIDRKNVFVKNRHRQKGNTQHEKQGDDRQMVTVHEGGLQFLVNLSDYIDTGLFLDHRTTRSMVRDESAGKRFLNLFAYTGSFSVYAAAGEAASTTTVDWSNSYLNWAKKNMALNGFRGEQHQFERASVVDFVQRLPEVELFDLVVIDPPTFSNSKRTTDEWETQRDHADLICAVARRMPSGSTLYFSTNFRRFKLAEEQLASFSIREISKQTVPEDFRNKRIHRCWKIGT